LAGAALDPDSASGSVPKDALVEENLHPNWLTTDVENGLFPAAEVRVLEKANTTAHGLMFARWYHAINSAK
jgi:hypothetical protein